MRNLAAIFGALAIAIGFLWIGQGMGYVTWPSSSFMLGDRQWSLYGGILALVGTLMMLSGSRWRR